MIKRLYNSVMRRKYNPLSNIPNLATGHLVMQLLAWMWCIIFSMYLGSIVAFGISALLHAILIAGVAVTVATFETAKRRPDLFKLRPGYHSVSRTRQTMWINGQRVALDPRDPGGEHE